MISETASTNCGKSMSLLWFMLCVVCALFAGFAQSASLGGESSRGGIVESRIGFVCGQIKCSVVL